MATNPKPVALVTGGSRGIGLAISEHLATSGFDLAVNGRRSREDVAETIEGLEARGARVLYCPGDVADQSARQQIVDAVHDSFGRLDVLVNNAGVAPEQRTDLLHASEESFDRVLQINLKGPYFLTQLVANWMIEQQSSAAGGFQKSIINVSSVSATVASTNRGDYCISKAGISMATRLWATRLAEFGIHVYEVRPGVIRTDMTTAVTEKYGKLIAEGLTVEPRWGLPDDVGKAVAVLARSELSYATGNVILVDGGLTLPRM